jgi:hypothetical protein
MDTSYVKYADDSLVSLLCHEGNHQQCPQGPDGPDGKPVEPPLFGNGYYCECDCGHEA